MDPNAEDYELLLPSDQLSKPRGHEDQLPEEGRKGDTFAMYMALVSSTLTAAFGVTNVPKSGAAVTILRRC